MTTRRSFLLGAGGILASFAAPAIVRADSLMQVIPIDTEVLTYELVTHPLFKGEVGRYDGVRLLDRDYYEGLQWTEAELEEISKRRPPAMVFNLIRP